MAHERPTVIEVAAKEWLDKVNGNSYFSAVITMTFADKSEKQMVLPFQYGYGDHYQHEAKKHVCAFLEIDPNSISMLQYRREMGWKTVEHIQTGCLKRNLEKWPKKPTAKQLMVQYQHQAAKAAKAKKLA